MGPLAEPLSAENARYPGAGLPAPEIPINRATLPRWQLRFFPKLEREEDHPTAWAFPAYLDASIPWVGVLKDLYATPWAFPASISPEAGLFLFSLVRNIRPRTVVEVGSFIGISTIWIAAALESAASDPSHGDSGRSVVHSFDDFGPMPPGPWRDLDLPTSRLPIIRAAIERAGLAHRAVLRPGDSSVEIVKARSELRATLSAISTAWGSPVIGSGAGPAGRGGVDLALLDGNHTIQGVLQDLWAVEPVLNPGGYLLLHDTFPEQCGDHQGPRHLIDHLPAVAQGRYELCEVYTAPLNYGMALLRRLG
jgi:hypothetical protein